MVTLFNHLKFKFMKNTNLLTIIIAFTFITGCRKTVEPQPLSTKGTLFFHIHTFSDTTEFVEGDTVRDASGRQFTYSHARLYISGITLIKLDGTSVPLNNAYLLVNPDQEDYLVGEAPTGNYKSVAFNIGIDSAHNHINPATYPATNILSYQTGMHFYSLGEGYTFINVQGKVDSTASMNGPLDKSFSYMVGIDSLLKHVSMPDEPFSILPGQTQYIHMYADYSKLFQGINLKTESDGYEGDAVSQKIANNALNIFSLE